MSDTESTTSDVSGEQSSKVTFSPTTILREFENLSPEEQDTALRELTNEAVHGDFDQLAVLGKSGLNGQIRGSYGYVFNIPYDDWNHIISLHFAAEAEIFPQDVALELTNSEDPPEGKRYCKDIPSANLYYFKVKDNRNIKSIVRNTDAFRHLFFLAHLAQRARKILSEIVAQTDVARFDEGEYLSLLRLFRYTGMESTDTTSAILQRCFDYATSLSETDSQKIYMLLDKIAGAFSNTFKDAPPPRDNPFCALYGTGDGAARINLDKKSISWTDFTGSGAYTLALTHFFVSMDLRQWSGLFNAFGERETTDNPIDGMYPPSWVRGLEYGLLLDVDLDMKGSHLVLSPYTEDKHKVKSLKQWIKTNGLGAWDLIVEHTRDDEPITIKNQPARENAVFKCYLRTNAINAS